MSLHEHHQAKVRERGFSDYLIALAGHHKPSTASTTSATSLARRVCSERQAD